MINGCDSCFYNNEEYGVCAMYGGWVLTSDELPNNFECYCWISKLEGMFNIEQSEDINNIVNYLNEGDNNGNI